MRLNTLSVRDSHGTSAASAIARNVYYSHMKRTQIYITEEQDQILSALASQRREPKAAVIRDILDAALDTGDAEGEAREEIRATAGILADAPDWSAWLNGVRGRTADHRMQMLHDDDAA